LTAIRELQEAIATAEATLSSMEHRLADLDERIGAVRRRLTKAGVIGGELYADAAPARPRQRTRTVPATRPVPRPVVLGR
jgi:hypothetical protein